MQPLTSGNVAQFGTFSSTPIFTSPCDYLLHPDDLPIKSFMKPENINPPASSNHILLDMQTKSEFIKIIQTQYTTSDRNYNETTFANDSSTSTYLKTENINAKSIQNCKENFPNYGQRDDRHIENMTTNVQNDAELLIVKCRNAILI